MTTSEALGLGLIVFVAAAIGTGVAARYWPASAQNAPPPGPTHHATPGPTDAVVFVDDNCDVSAPIKNATNYAFSGQTLTWKVKSKCADFNTGTAQVVIQFDNNHYPLMQSTAFCSGAVCKGTLNSNGVLNLPAIFEDKEPGGHYNYTISIATKPLGDPDLEIDP